MRRCRACRGYPVRWTDDCRRSQASDFRGRLHDSDGRMTTSSYVQAVTEVARAAGNRAQEFFATNLVVDTKADGSPVTIADRLAEQLAREWIAQRFPSDGIVGEE